MAKKTQKARAAAGRNAMRRKLIEAAKAGCRNHCPEFIKGALLTHKENFPAKTYAKLKLILG